MRLCVCGATLATFTRRCSRCKAATRKARHERHARKRRGDPPMPSVPKDDQLPTERPGPHLQMDVRDVLSQMPWDLMIAHPPCTYLASSGARWFHDPRYKDGRLLKQAEALEFVRFLYDSPIPKAAIENPVGYLSTIWRKPDFITHPYQHGHAETKQTCFWLKGLLPLKPSKIMPPPYATRCHRERPGVDRWKRRSRTLLGMAKAMAEQWG